MSDWVRFHKEIRKGDKRGIPRAFRFVYMELSQEARALRGHVFMALGMSDEDGVYDILGGNRKEVRDAVKALSAGKNPMIRFGEIEGKRAVIVTEWSTWNPVDPTGDERQRRFRNGKKRDDTRDTNATASRAVALSNRNDNGAARAQTNLLSSPSLPVCEEREPEEMSTGAELGDDERPSGVQPVEAMWPPRRAALPDLVDAFCEGVREHRSSSFSLPSGLPWKNAAMALDAESQRLAHPDAATALAWAKDAGAAYSAAFPGGLSSLKISDWIGSGMPAAPSGSPGRAVQPQAPGGRAWREAKGS